MPHFIFSTLILQATLLSPSLAQNSCTSVCKCFPELKYVNCSSQNISDSLPKVPFSTEYLDLSRNNIIQIQTYSFGHLLSLKHYYFEITWSRMCLMLSRNKIAEIQSGVFTSLCNVVLLDLSYNELSGLHFKTLLSICASNAHVLLEGNPWHCDCDLQRVFRKLDDIHRLFLDDYHKLKCSDPDELKGSLIIEVAHELCIAETVTVLILTGTVLITVVAAILMEKNKRSLSKQQSLDKDSAEEQAGLEGYCDN
ncbi:hypothetical protein WMY93_002144 [Mugilogobius chulae]|uniref:LRRCT domain-containing protein n=1 Tax=Mugilogobius chulae TaxID=88201 RepID=A0AAW0PUB5_9GOBI